MANSSVSLRTKKYSPQFHVILLIILTKQKTTSSFENTGSLHAFAFQRSKSLFSRGPNRILLLLFPGVSARRKGPWAHSSGKRWQWVEWWAVEGCIYFSFQPFCSGLPWCLSLQLALLYGDHGRHGWWHPNSHSKSSAAPRLKPKTPSQLLSTFNCITSFSLCRSSSRYSLVTVWKFTGQHWVGRPSDISPCDLPKVLQRLILKCQDHCGQIAEEAG